MDPTVFIAMWIIAMVGVILFFLIGVLRKMNVGSATPNKFSLRLFLKGVIRVIVSVIVIAFAIIYYPELSVQILGAPEPLEINGMTALLLGLTLDSIIKKIYDLSVDSGNVLYKRVIKK